ncbi:transcriptional regulator, TetR family [Pyramidobacter piscolens W5455]|uniref:Transcriptional regulator, TetR family n=1 Tax=Pyramidobacter piscolens W5455 TaxID=352165 RepID=A0ABM9ZY67_9BACT|nr:TetR/AcrR family transcriptional regulator [Pyramidobacter piscolens]EFB91854.1 transcriptional regulator, TetR family [Pyramidobacter piscolens W5455]
MGREPATQEKILAAATAEFLRKGFRGASLRQIVKNVGVTTGAFYRYYGSKEELFDALVLPHARRIMELYEAAAADFKRMAPEEQIDAMGEVGRRCMKAMYEYARAHRDAFRLILAAPESSKCGGFVHRLTEREIAETRGFMSALTSRGRSVTTVSPHFEHIVVSGRFAALFELIVHDVPPEEALKCIDQLCDFHRAGWAKLMGL